MLGTSEHNHFSSHPSTPVLNGSSESPLKMDTASSGGAATVKLSGSKAGEDEDSYNICWKDFGSNLGSFFRLENLDSQLV